MFYTTDPETRMRFITGLCQLASYLTDHPDVPVPRYGTYIRLCASPAEDGGREQVNHIARLLGAPVADDTGNGGHYTTARAFGPVSYEAASIPTTWRTWHEVQDSYYGCVTPDSEPSTTA